MAGCAAVIYGVRQYLQWQFDRISAYYTPLRESLRTLTAVHDENSPTINAERTIAHLMHSCTLGDIQQIHSMAIACEVAIRQSTHGMTENEKSSNLLMQLIIAVRIQLYRIHSIHTEQIPTQTASLRGLIESAYNACYFLRSETPAEGLARSLQITATPPHLDPLALPELLINSQGETRTLPGDIRPMLATGKYSVVTREADGESFIFPIVQAVTLDPNEVHSQECAPPPALSAKQEKSYLRWTRDESDHFILHSYRAIEARGPHNYIGRFSYHPETGEFIPTMIHMKHADAIRIFGSRPFGEYVRGIYIKERNTLLLRSYYNPLTDGHFDNTKAYSADIDRTMTLKTLQMLIAEGLPSDLKIIVHVSSNAVVGQYTSII